VKLSRPVFALTVAALAAGANVYAEDVADPVDPLEDQALREEAAARFEEALAGFEKAFDAAVEQAQAGGEAREKNLARAEVYLEKLETLSEATTKQGETGKFLAKHDATKLGPLLKSQVDWQRARLLLAEGDRDGAVKIADGLGWMRDWWVIGPFDNERGRSFKAPQPVEKKVDLDDELQGKERVVRWRRVPVQPTFGLIDLDAMLRPNDQALAYAVAWVKSDKAQDAALRVASDEAVKAWCNGREVLSRDVRRELGFDQDAVAVRLNEGWNQVLLKVCDQTGPWAFRVRLTAPDGSALAGVSSASTDEQAREALKTQFKAEPAQAEASAGAKAWYDRQTAGQAKRARDLFHLGLLHFRREYDSAVDRKAENLLRTASELEPQNAVYRFHYAEAASPPAELDAEKEENKQRQGREKAIELDPRYAVAYRALASYYTSSLPNLEKAEELLRRALDVNPAYVEARLDLANVLGRRGLSAQSEIERRRAMEDARAASLEATARAKASELEQRGMGREAIDAWNEVLRLDARGNDVRRRVAELAAAALQRDEAIRVLDAIALQNPYDLSALHRKADLLEGSEDYAGAEGVLRRALEIAPEDDELLQQLGRVQAKSGDVAGALRTYRLALEVNPKLQQVERYVEFLDPEAAPYEDDYTVDPAPLVAKAAKFENKDNDGYLVVLDQTVTKVNRDGTSSNYVRQVTKVLTEAGVKQFDRFWAQGWGQLKWKWARVTQAATGAVVDAKIQGAQADFPALRPGDLIDVAYRRDDREQSYFGDYFGDWQFFANYVPVLRTEYTLITPAERPFYFHQLNFDVKPEVTEKEKDGVRQRIYSWRNEDVAKVRYEDGMPGMREAFPQVQVSTYRDWNEFAKWWASMIRDQRILTDEMKAKVDALVAGRETRFEKIRAIYEFVTGEITYQAWSFGDHGYKPYTTSAIFEKREGDCKDKALLINTMLSHVGIESYPVLIYAAADGPREKEDLTLPMVGMFNHCIAWVPDVDGKGTPMFLDGTAQYHSIHTVPNMDRGATVLIVRPEGGEVVKIPEGTPADAGIDQTYRVVLRPDGGATVEAEMKWRGDMATQCRQIFSVEGQRARIIQMLFTRLFGKLSVQKVEFDDLKDLAQPWESFRVTLDVPAFAKKDGDAFTLPTTFLDGQVAEGMKGAASRPEREHDLLLGMPQSMNVKLSYVLPDGWTVDAKPEDADISLEAGAFRSKSALEGRELRLDRTYEFTASRVKREQYAAFRDAVNRMAATAAQRFKVRPGAAPAAPTAPAETPAEKPAEQPK
jgi:tetratricopeptide (TPR) repeat protein